MTKTKTKSSKPQRGVTYKCIKSFTDKWGDRARKGQRLVYNGTFGFDGGGYAMKHASGRGYDKFILAKKFTEHFVVLNPVK